VWARAILQDDFGVKPEDITWVRGGMEQPGRLEKIKLELPPNVVLESAPPDKTLSQMLAAGEIDGIVGPRLPSCFERGGGNVGWLFPDTVQAAMDYYRRTRIFPIMHLIGIRRTLAEKHPWLPATLLKAFFEAKDKALERLSDTSATKVTLPFVEEQLVAARRLMGADFWPYGLGEVSRNVLDTFLAHHHAQGLSVRRLSAHELFHPASLEMFRI
jgi:4,5-dihydroxyphthalate decarboxylase